MRNITLAVFLFVFSSLAFADSAHSYNGMQSAGHETLNRKSYETCINEFKKALHPRGLGVSMTYYAGSSLKADQRVLYINSSYFRDGQRIKVGIACKTNYRGQSLTKLTASIGAHYRLREGATNPKLLADN